MKQQIRNGVFETNSSSVHAMAILNDKEYEQYCKGQLRLDIYKGLVKASEVEYNDYIYLEKDHVTRMFENGKKLHAVAIYGHD